MKDIAWVGNQKDFERTFHTNKKIFIDKNSDTTYYCVSTPQCACGRRFDEVLCRWAEHNNLNQLYNEILDTRMKSRDKH